MITKQWLNANQLYHEEAGLSEDAITNMQPGSTFTTTVTFTRKFTSDVTYSLVVTPVTTNAGAEVYIDKTTDGSGATIKAYNRNEKQVIARLSFNWIAVGY